MRRQAGFTLLEIVVVVVIVAITVAMIAPQLSAGGRWRELQRETDTLALRVRVAQDIAMLEGREYGIVFADGSYRFVYWDADTARFRAVSDPSARWALRRLPEGMRVRADATSPEALLELPEPEEDATQSATTPAAPAEPDWEPYVFVLSSGEVTPFTATFSAEGETREFVVRIDPLGNRLREDGDAPR